MFVCPRQGVTDRHLPAPESASHRLIEPVDPVSRVLQTGSAAPITSTASEMPKAQTNARRLAGSYIGPPGLRHGLSG
jgi:hypothetical protein